MTNQDDQDLMDYLLELGALTPQQEQAMRQQKQVELLRQGSGVPDMRQAGRVSVAANPLEFLNSAARTGAAEYKQGQANQTMDAYGAARRKALEGLQQRRDARSMPPGATPGIVPPNGSPYGDDPYAVGGW
jgi:hypothetical protein